MDGLPARFGAWQCLGGYRSIDGPEQRLHHLHIARIRPLAAPRRRTSKLFSIPPNTWLIEGFSGLRRINRTCWQNLTLGSGICFYLTGINPPQSRSEAKGCLPKRRGSIPYSYNVNRRHSQADLLSLEARKILELLRTVCRKVLLLSKTTNILLSAFECLCIETKASLNDTLWYLELEVYVSLT